MDISTNKSQISLYLIIGVVIILIVLIFSFNQKEESSQNEKISEQSLIGNPVKIFVESCMKNVGEDGLYIIGAQGGYINPTPISLNTNFSSISYGYYEGVRTLPSLDTIAADLEMYIESQLPNCLNALEDFNGLNIAYRSLDVGVVLANNEVVINLKAPITIKDRGSTTMLTDFSIIVPVRFGLIYSIVETIVNNEVNDPTRIDITYLTNSGINSAIVPINNDTILYILSDNKTIIHNGAYNFLFVNKFIRSDLAMGRQEIKLIKSISDLSIKASEKYTFQVDSITNDKLSYSIFSSLNASSDDFGRVTIYPKLEDIGINLLEVDVANSEGMHDSQIAIVEVKND